MNRYKNAAKKRMQKQTIKLHCYTSWESRKKRKFTKKYINTLIKR